MTAPTIHCVNVIHPRRSGARTHSVSLKLVLAISEEEALRRVAAESDDGDLIRYRNVFEPAEVLTWSWQSWTRDDVASSSARPARALSPVTERDRARFWEDVVPYFGLDTSFDYEATPEVLLGYLKAYDRAEAAE